MSARRPSIRADTAGPRLTIVLAREDSAVSRARHQLSDFLHHVVSPALVDDARLVVSELVSNALCHGLGEVVVRASLADHRLQLSVIDSSEGAPRLLSRERAGVGGLGLRVVDQIAERWGYARFPGGKAVWAVLDISREPG